MAEPTAAPTNESAGDQSPENEPQNEPGTAPSSASTVGNRSTGQGRTAPAGDEPATVVRAHDSRPNSPNIDTPPQPEIDDGKEVSNTGLDDDPSAPSG